MQLTKGQDRFLNWVYVFLPLVAAVGTWAFAESGLRDVMAGRLAAPVAGYFAQVLQLAPDTWILLVLGCSFGTVFNVARRANLQRERCAGWLSLLTLLVASAHIVICAAFVLVLTLFFRMLR